MNKNLVFISISLAIWGIGEGLFLYFQPLYLQELGADPLMIGAVLGVVGMAMTAAHLPAGYLSDRLGRRSLLWAAWGLATIATWFMALSPSLPYFAVGAVVYGLTAFVAGPLNGYITIARGQWPVVKALTLVFAFYHLGSTLGPLLGGWIGASIGLRWSFVIAGILFLASFAVILRIEDQRLETQAETSLEQIKVTWGWHHFIFIMIIFVTMFFMYLPQPLSQNFLQNERALKMDSIGFLLATRSAGVVILNLILGRIDSRYSLFFAQIAMGLFAIFLWQGFSLPWYLAGYLLVGSYQTARSLIVAQGRNLINTHQINLAYGLFETIFGIVAVLASPLAGYLFSIDPTLPYRLSLFGICLSIFLSILFTKLSARITSADP